MFEYVRNHQKLLQIVLGLVTVPFAFWGIDSYVRGSSSTQVVASVGGQKIDQNEFDQAVRSQQDRMRGMFGKAYDPDKFDTPESRQALIDSLVDRRLIVTEAARGHLTVNNAELQDTILGLAPFQEGGKFSMPRYEAMARSQGMGKGQFDELIRSDLVLRQLTDTLETTAIPSKTVLTRWHAINEQEREVSQALFLPAQYLDQAKVTPEQSKAYYDANSKTFEAPQLVSAQYIVLSLDQFAADTPVSEDEIKAWYDAHLTQYATPEQRQASHILIAAPKDAPPADRAKARAKAEQLLAEVKAHPADFAAIAKKNSQDPGSAAKGGDLGMFSHGMMVKPFDDAAFSMKVGQISPVIETDFGYHVIKLDKIQPAGGKPLAEVHADIERELKKQKAQKKFADAADAFSNMVYEQADSLQPAADKYKLKIQSTPLFAKSDAATAAPALNNPKLLNALFSDDAIKNKHNTEAVETAANTLVSARVVQSQPSRIKSFAEMSPVIELILRTKDASAIALKKAEATLADLKKGGNPDIRWNTPKVVSRGNPGGLQPADIDAIFKVDSAKLPGYAIAEGAENTQSVFRVSAVRPPVVADTNKRKSLDDQLSQTMTREDFAIYLAALRAKTSVKVNQQNLLRKDR